jgi:hypothetical protein
MCFGSTKKDSSEDVGQILKVNSGVGRADALVVRFYVINKGDTTASCFSIRQSRSVINIYHIFNSRKSSAFPATFFEIINLIFCHALSPI